MRSGLKPSPTTKAFVKSLLRPFRPFDGIFFINRDADTERLSALTARLRALDVQAERLVPIPDRSPGRSCTLTHAAVVREARRRNLRSVLILEDDVVFHSQLPTLWLRIAAQLGSIDYDLFYLYRWDSPADEWPCKVIRAKATLCTHCYSVHGRYFDRFIELLESNSHGPVDEVLRSAPEAAIYATSVNLAGQDAGTSLLDQTEKRLRWRASDG